MGSTHFFAVPPQPRLRERPGPDVPRELFPPERRAIRDLSARLEERTLAWLDKVNRRGDWERYYSHTAHYWFEEVARANGKMIPPANRLYLRYAPQELFCTGIEDEGSDDRSFFGFLNLDDVETNLEIEPFLREYVRRLSALVPDLLWCFEYGEDAYWRGLAISIKHRGTIYPYRTAPRRDRIPPHVLDALGYVPPLPPERCQLCGRTDHGVTPQLLSDAVAPAHVDCFKIYWRGVRGGMPPSGRDRSRND
jgi:hypothetical protein